MKLVLSLLFIFSSVQAATISQCLLEGEKLGDGKGNNSISSACLELLQADSSSIVSRQKEIIVTGLGNTLITFDSESKRLSYISGKASRLIDISKIHFDYTTMRALVYSRGNQYLLTFNSRAHGNIAPIFRFPLVDLESGVEQVLQLSGHKLNAILLSNNEIRFYREKAMEHAHRPQNITKMKYKLVDKEGAFGQIRSIGYDKDKGFLILNSEKGKFSVEIEKLPTVVIKPIL